MKRRWAGRRAPTARAHPRAECTFLLLDPELEGSSHGGALCGDVNLFLNDPDKPTTTAEVEVMVAEPRSRRKGVATEALAIFMAYAAQQLGITKFRAKIKEHNAASIALFTGLGFAEVKRVAVFGEVRRRRRAARGAGGASLTPPPSPLRLQLWMEAPAEAALALAPAFEQAPYDP